MILPLARFAEGGYTQKVERRHRIIARAVLLLWFLPWGLPPSRTNAATDMLRLIKDVNISGKKIAAITQDPTGTLYAGVMPHLLCVPAGPCSNCSADVSVAKYDRDLNLTQLENPGLGGGNIWDVALDSGNNVYVGVNCGFWKLNSSPVFQSSVTMGAGSDDVRAIAINTVTDEIYVIGLLSSSFDIAKYDTHLVFLASASLTADGYAAAVNETTGDVYVAVDDAVERFSGSAVFISSSPLVGGARGVSIAAGGVVFVSGVSGSDFFIEKRSSDLTLLGRRTYPVGGSIGGPRVALDASGDVYVVGSGAGKITALKYDSNLQLADVNSRTSGEGHGIAVDQAQEFLFAGGSAPSGSAWVGKLGVDTASDVSNGFGYPSPFSRSLADEMTFINLAPNASLRIYTLGRQFVRELTASSGGVALWDVRDASGGDIPPGTYHVVAESENSRKVFSVMVLP